MQNLWIVLTGVAAMWLVAVITPGPNFFITVRTGIIQDKDKALWVVSGIAAGTFIWGLSGFFGITALFTAAPTLYIVLKILGGLYIMYLGIKLFLSSFDKTNNPEYAYAKEMTALSAFRLGITTNLSNPKTAAFVASLFAAVMPESPNICLGLSCAFLMSVISILWYGFVGLMVSRNFVSNLFKRMRRWIDRTAGVIFFVFGIKMISHR